MKFGLIKKAAVLLLAVVMLSGCTVVKDSIKKEMESVRSEISSGLSEAKEEIFDGLEEAKSEVSSAMEEARGELASATDGVREEISSALDEVHEEIAEAFSVSDKTSEAQEAPEPAETTIDESAIDESAIDESTDTTLAPVDTTKQYTFRTKKQFDDHYIKHGAEFGDITQDEYLRLANELIADESDKVLHKREKEDDDYLYFNTENNYFLVLSTDGYIRTFFIPSAGIKYWERQ